jgi:chorismate mutase
MAYRGIRGAVCVEKNETYAIIEATQTLLQKMVDANSIQTDDIASIIFTATADLDAAYPARAARELGWINVPLLCMQEMDVVGSLPYCIRVLMSWNTERPAGLIQHIYLGKACQLRPDLAQQAKGEKST